MKRNLILVSILGLILWGAWHGEQRENEMLGVLGLVAWEQVTAIKTPGVNLKKMQDKWVVSSSGKDVDGEKIKELWAALGRIQTAQEITKSGVLYHEAFPHSFDRFVIHFNGGRMEILLGIRLPFDQSFYLETIDVREGGKVTRRWIAQDVSPEPGIYNVKTVYRSPAKYQRLKLLLELKADDFYHSVERS